MCRIRTLFLFINLIIPVSVEFPQNDQPDCGKNVKADVMFAYDSVSLGLRKVNLIHKFIADVVSNFSMEAGNIRTGIVSTKYKSTEIGLEDHTAKDSFISRLQEHDVRYLYTVVRRLRLHSYNPQNGGRPNVKQIAIIFIDDVITDLNSVMPEVRRARFNHIEIFMVPIGDKYNITQVNAIATSHRHILVVGSYQQLRNRSNDCINMVCRGEFPNPLPTLTTTSSTELATSVRSTSTLAFHKTELSLIVNIGQSTSSGSEMFKTEPYCIYQYILLIGLLVKHGID